MSNPTERFWSKVDKTDSCWLWTAGTSKNGYGKMSYGGRVQYAHRLAWYFTYGLLDINLVVDHKCHNKRCVNPEHLQLVTESQNMQNRSGLQSNSKSGVRGVHWHESASKWRVQVKAGGASIVGGYSPTSTRRPQQRARFVRHSCPTASAIQMGSVYMYPRGRRRLPDPSFIRQVIPHLSCISAGQNGKSNAFKSRYSPQVNPLLSPKIGPSGGFCYAHPIHRGGKV